MNTRFPSVGAWRHDAALARIDRWMIPAVLLAVAWSQSIPSASAAAASPSFADAVHIDTGLHASGIAVGDFNFDGALDMAVTNQKANNVSILLGDGTGKFSSKTDLPAGGPPQRITVGDLNRDGKLDLVMPIQAADTVSVLLGDGKGGFGPPVATPVKGAPFMVFVADLNLDGNPDVVVTTTAAGSRGIALLLGDGRGGFSPPTYHGNFGNAPLPLGIEDFNRDGKPDVAVGGGINSPEDTNNLTIFLGDGRGNFGSPTYFTLGRLPQSMSIGDFNADGVADLAVSNSLATGGSSTVSVLIGDGRGGFSARTPYAISEGGRGTGVADFNLDGKLDLVVANSGSNTVSVLLGDGRGGFGAKTDFAVGNRPRKLCVGDFNHDGKPDIATPNTVSNNVSILINTCRPPSTNRP